VKIFKRNAIILTMIVFVCAAVYLNWAYNKSEKTSGTSTTQGTSAATAGGSGLFYESKKTGTTDYFSAARLERQQARDEAVSKFSAAVQTMSTSQQERDSAAAKMNSLTETALNEKEIESMIKAKGFTDCVVFLKDNAAVITVARPADGLNSSSVAQVADIVTQQTKYTLAQIKINEVK
jgi:stage III sporulation protein AH